MYCDVLDTSHCRKYMMMMMIPTSFSRHYQTATLLFVSASSSSSCKFLFVEILSLEMTTPGSSSRVKFDASSSGVAAKKQAPSQPLTDPATNLPGEEIKPLSVNPYFGVVLPKSSIGRGWLLGPPASLELPSAEIPTVFKCGGKSWNMMYNGMVKAKNRKFFSSGGWRRFAEDNGLKVGDGCIFELMEKSEEKLVFQVQILSGDIPSMFLEREEVIGKSSEEPIIID